MAHPTSEISVWVRRAFFGTSFFFGGCQYLPLCAPVHPTLTIATCTLLVHVILVL